MKISFFGSSLVSAYWNGAATYYRGVLGALAARGHEIVFFEPDAYDRQRHRDIPDPEWARVVVYPATEEGVRGALAEAADADVVVKASGVGAYDDLLESAVLDCRRSATRVLFWDVDAPATLDRLMKNPDDPFRECVPEYDFVFTYGGGPPVIEGYEAFGARKCVPIYNAVDPETHHRVEMDARYDADLAFMGNCMPDRQERVHEFVFNPANRLPERRFLLGGNGWQGQVLPENVRYLGHVYTREHNAFNSTPRVVLNVSRDSMARYGYSPATRVFEAAAAGACILSDAWEGAEMFFEPGKEWLLARNGEEVAEILDALTPDEAREIGYQAMERVFTEHTYAQRADGVMAALNGSEA